MNLQKQLFFTSYQKILKYFVSNPSDEYVEKDIQDATSLSKAGVNFVLRSLVDDGLVNCKKRGKFSFYSVNLNHPLIRQSKVLLNLIEVDPLVKSLSNLCEKIILFGSSATGTNIEESDIDLFILTNNPDAVMKIINKGLSGKKIQAIVKKPIEYLPLKTKDPVFYEEVSRGLIIWEKKG